MQTNKLKPDSIRTYIEHITRHLHRQKRTEALTLFVVEKGKIEVAGGIEGHRSRDVGSLLAPQAGDGQGGRRTRGGSRGNPWRGRGKNPNRGTRKWEQRFHGSGHDNHVGEWS